MIILEGPDGAGKTRLLEDLVYLTQLSKGPRASDSLTGPVPEVFDWAMRDLSSWATRPLSIYDRHPLISEPIYGPVIRGKLDRRFHDVLTAPMWRLFKERALIILCLPPFGEVQKNIMSEQGPGQMTGVQEYRKELYDAYVKWGLDYLGNEYAGVLYDYTDTTGNYNFQATLNAVIDFQERSKV